MNCFYDGCLGFANIEYKQWHYTCMMLSVCAGTSSIHVESWVCLWALCSSWSNLFLAEVSYFLSKLDWLTFSIDFHFIKLEFCLNNGERDERSQFHWCQLKYFLCIFLFWWCGCTVKISSHSIQNSHYLMDTDRFGFKHLVWQTAAFVWHVEWTY